jgi:DNA helicase-2/ATP-dependent DNA helicase PcrA
MYNKYQRLCDLLIDSFHFIFVDEYQDTSPLVIEILLSFLAGRSKKNIIGFFGDSMQSIYDATVGDIDSFVLNGQVVKIEKEQNRRNPFAVIHLANQLRTDGLEQKPSDDSSAPNMKDGAVKTGSIKFLYSTTFNLEKVKSSSWCNGWDFSDAKKTKELRLTHNLIADEAGFAQLMAIYDADPIAKFKRDFRTEAEKCGLIWDAEDTFESVVNSMDWAYKTGARKGRQRRDVFLEDALSKKLYDYVKGWLYSKVQKIYFDKDNLIGDRVVIDGVTIHEPKLDRLIQHLFKIQEIISLYHKKQYNELIQKTSFQINSIADKKVLRDAIAKISALEDGTIKDVIDYADASKLCVKDDKLQKFLEENEYLYWRVKDVLFKEFQRLYMYLEGYVPLSTQHKIKGLEFDNVLIVLHNGGWSNYNFEYLFDSKIFQTLTPARQANYPSILSRTKKLFYVCCTRAKENLVVFYPDPTPGVLAGAESLFGQGDCVNLDT